MQPKISIKHCPGDSVTVLPVRLLGRIMEVVLGGSAGMVTVMYTVRYWSNGDLFSASFDDDELETVEKKPITEIGFSK